ncbi:unnamed protein product [marine sediment metagenome]|uniref:Uncharacterized protein n=1 Tax=marine sediment metagenome TaxID=412755 RepID=X1DF98_9ZZZZ
MRSAIVSESFPLILITAIPPVPGGVEIATIVPSEIIFFL